MNNTIRKFGVLAATLCTGFALCAFPGPHHGGFHHHHHGGAGFAIGAGILGAGLLAHTIYDATHPVAPVVVAPAQPVVVTQPVVTQPVVVQQPVVTQPVVQQQTVVQQQPAGHYETQTQNVWVEGRYVDQTNAQGFPVRVWQPGHYEQVQTQVWVQ